MVLLALLLLFGVAYLVTTAFEHDELRWRYPAAATAVCAAALAAWGAKLLTLALRPFSTEIHPVLAVVLAGLPGAATVFNLWIRRQNAPRHTPGLDDDPVLRRYLEEKTRRHRRRRQAEELEASADDVRGN